MINPTALLKDVAIFNGTETRKKCHNLLNKLRRNTLEMELGSRDEVVTKADIERTLKGLSF